MSEQMSYKQAGVDIEVADATKADLGKKLSTRDPRVLNAFGAFASVVRGNFEGMAEPVLVLKTEEPGSKQKIAFQMGRVESIAQDLINHLVNDIIVMGAHPMYVQDCIVCGKMEPDVVKTLVGAMAQACIEVGAVLVGGETSEQPGVLEAGLYVLSASIVGVADRSKLIDGSGIQEGDVVLAVASNGLHTNGYSLVRKLLERQPDLASRPVERETFLDVIMRPHTSYYQGCRGLFEHPGLHGMAHITGGGIAGNLNRILPAQLNAWIDTGLLQVPEVFRVIQNAGQVSHTDMLQTYNLGVGLTLVVAPDAADAVISHLQAHNHHAYPIGEIRPGAKTVEYSSEEWV